jgi:hypothetical protein
MAARSGDRELTMDAALHDARTECRMLYEEEFSNAESQRFYLL